MSVPATRSAISFQRANDTPSRSYIGRPTPFSSGPWAGRNIIARIEEIQKADRGRRCGVRDRRPLDPPPVIRLRLYEVRECGPTRYREEEVTHLTEVENAGWMCQVDLFPVSRTEVSLSPPQYRNAVSPASSRHTNEYSPVNETSHLRPQYTYPPPLPTNPNSGDINSSSTTHRPTEPYNVGGNDGQRDLRSTPHSVMMANNSNACTTYLVGTLVATSSLVFYGGSNQILFAYHDVSVKEDGDYYFRYRVFNTMYNVAGEATFPVLAECFGGSFTVYGTKDFPGLAPSTELTKHIMLSGVPVHYRETERKRRKSLNSGMSNRELHPAPSLLPPTAGPSTSMSRAPIPAPQAYYHTSAVASGVHPSLHDFPGPEHEAGRRGGQPGPS